MAGGVIESATVGHFGVAVNDVGGEGCCLDLAQAGGQRGVGVVGAHRT